MIDICFKECCRSCNNLDLEYEQTSSLVEQITVIGCSHSCVCEKYRAEPDDEESPRDVTVKGFRNADR